MPTLTTATPWNSPGASTAGVDYNGTAMATANVPLGTTTSTTWTFTSLTAIQGWVTSTATNFGMVLASTGAQVNNVSYRLFDSAESGGTLPSLTVTYS